MTEAEKALLEAVVKAELKGAGWRGFCQELMAVRAERLDQEVPGWQLEAKAALRMQMHAERAWNKWSKRLADAGIDTSYSTGTMLSDWYDEIQKELGD